MVVARKNSPLIIGVGEKENYVSSDVNALIPHTKKVIYLDDNCIAQVCKQNIELYDFDGNKSAYKVSEVNWTSEQSEKMAMTILCRKKFMSNQKLFVQY